MDFAQRTVELPHCRSINDEVKRQGDFVIAEFERYASGLPLRYAETAEMLDRMAST
jgi:hypothetical protein